MSRLVMKAPAPVPRPPAPSPRSRDAGPGSTYAPGVRATWLTDLHLNFLRPLARKRFYEVVAAERPGVLLVTGDTAEAPSLA